MDGMKAVKVTAGSEIITVTRESVTVPMKIRSPSGNYARAGSRWIRPCWVIPCQDVQGIWVSGHDRRYLTGRRAAAAVLTGGAALAARSRVRGVLVISTTAGDVFQFTLTGRTARNPEAVAAAFASRGYAVH